MTTPEETDDRRERVAKVIARAGLCSRREAEEWIAAGRVAINGTVLDTPAHTVGEDDRVTVDGAPLPAREPTRLWLYHKPRGLVTTNSDPEGRPTVFEHLPAELPRVVTIGRLDINTEGLLLLTNDGGLARVLELPATGWLRRYRVRAHGEVTQADLDKLQEGVAVDGVLYGPVEATLDRVQGANAWLMIGIREGKNREVKQVLGTLGLEVSRLIRISFGPFQLADLEPGEVREIRGRILRDQLGERLAEEAGCVFATGHVDDDRPRGKAAAKAPRTLKGKPAPGEVPAAPRPGARERAAGAGRGRAGDRPLSGGGERSRGMISRDEGRSRGTRSHEDGGRGAPRTRGPRPVEGDRPANHRPRILAPQDWTGEYAAEGPAPKKEDRPQKRGARSDGPREGGRGEGSRGGPRAAASRTFGGEGPRTRSASPRGFGSDGDAPRGRGAPRSAGSRGEAPGGDERPPRVGRPPRGTSVWRADDAGGRPLRARETGARVERPARGDDAPPSRARGSFDRPRADGDRPVRRRPDAEGSGWSPPTGPVTASDTPSRRMKARARDAGLLGDAAPARPARAPRRPASEGAERRARAPRAGGDRPYTPRPPRAEGERTSKPRAPRAEGDRPARAPRAEGERTYKPRAPRAEGERTYAPRPPRGDGERTYKPRAPRSEGDRPARAPRAEGERTYTPRPPRGDGERTYKPRAPRGEGERSYTPRAPRAEGERTYKPRPPGAEGDRPARPPRAGKPSFGGDRPSGPPKGRPRSDGPRASGPKGSGPKGAPRGGGPKGRPSGGAPRGRPRGGA